MLFFVLILSTLRMAQAEEVVLPTPPIYVQYQKTGRETNSQAEKLGAQEVADGNPCVTRMVRELEKLVSSEEMKEAEDIMVKAKEKDRKLQPNFVLYYMYDSIELRFELRPAMKKAVSGRITKFEETIYRKGVVLDKVPGNWKDRLNNGRCTVADKQVNALIDELRESDRLKTCQDRKVELLAASKKLTKYVHTYIPANWLEDVKQALSKKQIEVGDLLREDDTIYRQGAENYRACNKGLKLLEREGTNTVHVLNEIKASKLEAADLPVAELADFEKKLSR